MERYFNSFTTANYSLMFEPSEPDSKPKPNLIDDNNLCPALMQLPYFTLTKIVQGYDNYIDVFNKCADAQKDEQFSCSYDELYNVLFGDSYYDYVFDVLWAHCQTVDSGIDDAQKLVTFLNSYETKDPQIKGILNTIKMIKNTTTISSSIEKVVQDIKDKNIIDDETIKNKLMKLGIICSSKQPKILAEHVIKTYIIFNKNTLADMIEDKCKANFDISEIKYYNIKQPGIISIFAAHITYNYNRGQECAKVPLLYTNNYRDEASVTIGSVAENLYEYLNPYAETISIKSEKLLRPEFVQDVDFHKLCVKTYAHMGIKLSPLDNEDIKTLIPSIEDIIPEVVNLVKYYRCYVYLLYLKPEYKKYITAD